MNKISEDLATRKKLPYEHEKYTYLARLLTNEQIDQIIAMQGRGELSIDEEVVTQYILQNMIKMPLTRLKEFDADYNKMQKEYKRPIEKDDIDYEEYLEDWA
jgi:hypothetical protein